MTGLKLNCVTGLTVLAAVEYAVVECSPDDVCQFVKVRFETVWARQREQFAAMWIVGVQAVGGTVEERTVKM